MVGLIDESLALLVLSIVEVLFLRGVTEVTTEMAVNLCRASEVNDILLSQLIIGEAKWGSN